MKKAARVVVENMLLWCAKKLIDRFSPFVVLITGSAGKTTTKYVVGAVLKEKYQNDVLVGFGNLSTTSGIPLAMLDFELSDIGSWQLLAVVPFALLKTLYILLINRYYKYLVLEVAADRVGDIAKVTRSIVPDVGIVTNVGPAHIKYFGNLHTIAKEKSEVIQAVKDGGLVILGSSDSYVRKLASRSQAKVVYIDGTLQTFAAKAAKIIGEKLGLDSQTVEQGLKKVILPKGRFDIINGINNTKIIDSSYNANPTSVKAVVDEFCQIPTKGKRIALLGDMLELGDSGEALHREVGAYVRDKIDLLIAVGKLSKVMPADFFVGDWQEAKTTLLNQIGPGDTILVKASHGVHLEKVVQALREKK